MNKKILIFSLIILDLININLSVYVAAYIVYSKIEYLNLFKLYSISFFLINFITFWLFNNYSYFNRYFDLENIKNIFFSVLSTFLSIIFLKHVLEFANIRLFFYDYYFLEYKIIITQVLFFLLATLITRYLISQLSLIFYSKSKKEEEKLIAIYGAGETGILYSQYLKLSSSKKVACFIDDNASKIGRHLPNGEIMSLHKFLNLKKVISEVIICIPSLDSSKKKYLTSKFNRDIFRVKFFEDIRHNNLKEFIKKFSEDSQNINNNEHNKKLKDFFKNKTVVVTGAGGSIGREVCFQLSNLKVKKIIAIDQDEYRLSLLKSDFENIISKSFNLEIKLANLTDYDLLEGVLKKSHPDIIFHAAASKHVDIVEDNWYFATLNNVISTYNLLKINHTLKIKKFINISTDKAVKPINFLGFSKAITEKMVKIFGYEKRNKFSTYSSVRFGNIIGSSGSLLEVLNRQIEAGGPVKITDARMERYFMTISDAVNLVLISALISKNGDCLVIKMGKPKKIMDIVNSLLDHHRENNKNSKIKIIFTGPRPGEKLSENLYDDRFVFKTSHQKIVKERKLTKSNLEEIEILIKNIISAKNSKNIFKNQLLKFLDE